MRVGKNLCDFVRIYITSIRPLLLQIQICVACEENRASVKAASWAETHRVFCHKLALAALNEGNTNGRVTVRDFPHVPAIRQNGNKTSYVSSSAATLDGRQVFTLLELLGKDFILGAKLTSKTDSSL